MHEPPGRDWSELLHVYLDSLEDIIRNDLAALAEHRGTVFRGERKQLRLLDLTAALEGLGPARAALAECPAGAKLAMCVVGVLQDRLRSPVEVAALRDRGGQKGAYAKKPKRRRRAAPQHTRLRARAAKLNPRLSALAKARILARSSTLSAERIRKIISK